MSELLKKAVESKSEIDLENSFGFDPNLKIKPEYYQFVVIALKETWHEQHEDIINTIYLDNLIDDRFVEPILNIALNGEIYRPYDLDLESSLRKCIHALKTIDSEKAKEAINKLKKLNNDNIRITLEMYD